MTRPNADVSLKNVDKFIPSRNVLKLLDDKLVPENSSKIVNTGSCPQHVVHEALKTETKSSEFDTDKILKSMFCLIESSPARRDVYLKEGISGKFPLRQ